MLTAPAKTTAQAASPVAITWVAPAGCPSEQEVRARVEQLAGASARAPVEADATVTRTADAVFHLRLVTRAEGRVGERSIEAASCADLAGAAAVAVALLSRGGQPPLPTAPDAGAPEPSVVAHAEPDQAAPEAKKARPTVRGLIGAPLLIADYGPLHRPSVGLALSAGVGFGRFLLLGEGRAFWPQEASRLRAGQRYGADVRRFAAGLRVCRTWALRRLALAPCLALAAEHLWSRGTGPGVAPRDARATWLSAGVVLEARLPLAPWLNLVWGIHAQVQTARPTLHLEGAGTIERLLPFAGGLTLGTEWIL